MALSVKAKRELEVAMGDKEHADEITTALDAVIAAGPTTVSPSVVDNILTFSGVAGQCQDSGVAIGAVAAAQGDATDALAGICRVKHVISATVNVVVNATDVGGGFAVAIPAHSILHGLMIEAAAPGGTAGGAKTISYSVGSVQNADADLTDPTDIDIMIAKGPVVAAPSTLGDSASDHVAVYFPMDEFGAYFAAPTNIFLNYIGQSANATAVPGTVTCAIKVWALLTLLS